MVSDSISLNEVVVSRKPFGAKWLSETIFSSCQTWDGEGSGNCSIAGIWL